MYNKKIIYILILLIVSMCAISAVSAEDNATDAVAADDADANDTISVDDAKSDDVASNFEENTIEQTEEVNDGEEKLSANDGELLSLNDDDSTLTLDQTNEKKSLVPLFAGLYSVTFLYEDNTIQSNKDGKIYVYIDPCKLGTVGYQYYYEVYDEDLNVIWESELQTASSSVNKGNYYTTIPAKSLVPGLYIIAAVNAYDEEVLDSALLYVSGSAVLTAGSDYNSVYMSGATMSARITDKITKKPLGSGYVQAKFTKGETTVIEYYTPNSDGYIYFVPPVGVGTWSVTFSSGYDHISTAVSATKTVIITKAPVKVAAYKVIEYKGHKTTLKAKVTSNGKNVNEGTVTFKINGKKYNAAVKNGFATVSVNLKKIKTYKYSAIFSGDNFQASNVAKSKAVLKKSFKTKLYGKNYEVFIFKKKTAKILVKTKNGKKVKNGMVKITVNGVVTYAKVKNGVAKVPLKGLSAVDHFKGFTKKGETYKRFITKKVKLNYIPGSHKYKASSKTIKVTSVFKCPGCGKTSTHYHKARDSYGVPYKHFIAIV